MKRITPAMMAEALGYDSAQTVRVGLQVGAFDWGVAFKQTGNTFTYVIYPEKARAVVGENIYKKWEAKNEI